MKDWERIRIERRDITDYVIHCIRDRYENRKHIKPIDTLIEILKCGYIKPSFAARTSIYGGSKRDTIKGPYPAVCFMEQTLENFITSCHVLQGRYRPYGIALHKRALFKYGGRPVIYGSEDILGRKLKPNEPEYEQGKEIYTGGLPKEYQYLWVRYQPVPDMHGYVVDWTHEREWRCRVKTFYHDIRGFLPREGVPIFLPQFVEVDKNIRHLPILLVLKQEEKELLGQLIKTSPEQLTSECKNEYFREYLEILSKIKIVAIDEAEEHLNLGESHWARLEGIPLKIDDNLTPIF